MKKIIGYLGIFSLLVSPVFAFAADIRTGEQPTIAASERIFNDVYIAGGSVTSAGVVQGDLVVGGGSVVVSGTIKADVLAGGGNVAILSAVEDDVRAVGGTVMVQGRVGGDVIVGGGQISIGGPGITGDVIAGGGSVRIDAPVAGSVRIGSGSVYLNAPIAGNVVVQAGTLTLGSSAVISGSLTYSAQEELTKEAGAIVRGEIQFEPRAEKKIPAAFFAILFSVWFVGKFLALLVCALLLGLLFRRYFAEIVSHAAERPLQEIGRGLVVVAAAPVISIICMVTIVGIPLGILGMLGFIIILVTSWIVSPILLGSMVFRYLTKVEGTVTWKTIIVGVVIYSIAGLVPFVGWLAQILLTLLSIGVIAGMKWRIVQEWR